MAFSRCLCVSSSCLGRAYAATRAARSLRLAAWSAALRLPSVAEVARTSLQRGTWEKEGKGGDERGAERERQRKRGVAAVLLGGVTCSGREGRSARCAV